MGACNSVVIVMGWAIIGLFTLGITSFATAIVLLVVRKEVG